MKFIDIKLIFSIRKRVIALILLTLYGMGVKPAKYLSNSVDEGEPVGSDSKTTRCEFSALTDADQLLSQIFAKNFKMDI